MSFVRATSIDKTFTIQDVQQALKQLIIEVTQSKISIQDIQDTANLFNDCGVDSTSIIELVLAIEDRFGINIDEREMDVKLFQNLSALTAFVENKLNPGL